MTFNKSAYTLLFISILWLSTGTVKAELVDRIIAIVNEETITMSELDAEGAPLFKEIRMKTPPGKTEEVISNVKEQILDSLIEKSLITQKAKELRIHASDEEVVAAHQRMLKGNKVSQEEFLEKLKIAGRSEEDYKDTIRYQIIQSKIVNSYIRSKIVISEEEIAEYYQNEVMNQEVPDGYHILQIGFVWTNGTSGEDREKLREQAEKIRKIAISGEDFRYLAATYSQMPSAEDGGDIGVFKENEMSGVMKDALATLEAGQVSKMVETSSGLQFFKLVSFRDGDIVKFPPLEIMKDEITEHLTKKKTEEQFKAWYNEIKEQAFIKKML